MATSSRGGRTRNAGMDFNPTRIPPPLGNTITVSGEDRLASFDVKANQSVFQNFQITPGSSQRLETISRAYQRIKWNSVTVIVTPQASSITNGGYVAGFVMDPTDRSVTAVELSSTQGAQTKKWYEGAVVRMPKKTDLLYTSPGEDPRFMIPSTFWIAGEGTPSSNITVVVTILWNITLSVPSYENVSSSSFVMSGEVRGKTDNYDLAWYKNGTDPNYTADVSSLIPAHLKLQTGNHFFRVPTFNIEYKEGTGDTGTIQAHFLVYKTDDKKFYYSSNGREIFTEKWQSDVQANQVCVPCGTFCKYTGMGNGCRSAPPQLSPSRKESRSLSDWEKLQTRLLQMEKSLKELRNSSRPNSMIFLDASMITNEPSSSSPTLLGK